MSSQERLHHEYLQKRLRVSMTPLGQEYVTLIQEVKLDGQLMRHITECQECGPKFDEILMHAADERRKKKKQEPQ